jgi:hypothetical protein
MKKFTKKQIKDWKAYEKVRSGGRYNMFDPRAKIAAGLCREDYLFVMAHYEKLREQAKAK